MAREHAETSIFEGLAASTFDEAFLELQDAAVEAVVNWRTLPHDGGQHSARMAALTIIQAAMTQEGVKTGGARTPEDLAPALTRGAVLKFLQRTKHPRLRRDLALVWVASQPQFRTLLNSWALSHGFHVWSPETTAANDQRSLNADELDTADRETGSLLGAMSQVSARQDTRHSIQNETGSHLRFVPRDCAIAVQREQLVLSHSIDQLPRLQSEHDPSRADEAVLDAPVGCPVHSIWH